MVRQVADRVLVMHLGEICHMGSVDSLFTPDAAPYVRNLVASIPGQAIPSSINTLRKSISAREPAQGGGERTLTRT